MHGQQNDKYTEMQGQQNDKYTEMHGQQNDKYTEMHGQQNDKYTEMHGQQNVKIWILIDSFSLISSYVKGNTSKLNRPIHFQLNWAVLLCDIIPDGKTK